MKTTLNYVIILIGIVVIVIAGRWWLNSSDDRLENMKKIWTEPPAMTVNVDKKYTVDLETSEGKITMELFAAETPITVNNFVFLAEQGFYNDTIFHRIIKGFMIQGGDPKGDGTGGPGYKFADESISRDYKRGIVAMANSGPNTNGSQFFIMHQDYPLPPNYVIFGQVIDGLDVLDKIANTAVVANEFGESSKPLEEVAIKDITINAED
ncbi:MAG: peptidylprolyl isomerase [bacterium]|nr:peptidylprolyl isomerase [bacterium]